MCIVSIFPKGKVKNSEYVKEFIANGMQCNSHGSGYMFKRNGEKTITIVKGFFRDVDTMLNSIDSHSLLPEDELVVHHRIATSGLQSKENCHPFVLSTKHQECCDTSITTDKPCLAHNGMFSGLRQYMDLDNDFSDTYAMARYVLSNPQVMKIMIDDPNLFKTIFSSIINSSKLAILHPDYDIIMIGDYIEDEEGYFHSNRTYCGYSNFSSFSNSARNATNWEDQRKKKESSTSSQGAGVSSTSLIEKRLGIGLTGGEQLANRTIMASVLSKNYDSTQSVNSFINLSVVLDSNLVILDNRNCHHFLFIRKDDFINRRHLPKLEIFKMTNYAPGSKTQSLNTPLIIGSSGVVYHTMNTEDVTTNFYYIPLYDFMYMYKQYQYLCLNTEPIGKQTLKKVERLLSNNYNKLGSDLVYYKRLDTRVTKAALELFKGALVRELEHQAAGNTSSTPASLLADAIDNGESVEVVNQAKDLKELAESLS